MKAIEEHLLKLLKDDQPRVLAIKGPWGIGKTYFWTKFVENYRRKISEYGAVKAYSYISLFGLRDVAEVKRTIFSKHGPLGDNWSEESGFEGIVARSKKIGSWLTEAAGESKIPYLGAAGMVSDWIEESSVKDYLICFDDLDRKEDSLSMKSFLGLVSALKLEKSCRIVVILNDDAVEEEGDDGKVYKKYKEKVFDLEISYKPTVVENLKKVFDDTYSSYLLQPFENLGLNNVRTMIKAKEAVDEVVVFSEYAEIYEQLRSMMLKGAIVAYSYADLISVEELTMDSRVSLEIESREDDADPKLKKKREIMDKLDYHGNDLDGIVHEYLTDGYIDFEKWKDLLSDSERVARRHRANAEHWEIWGKYHNNFKTSAKDFIKMQEEFLDENYLNISVKDLYVTLEFIKELGCERDFSDMLSKAIDSEVDQMDGIDYAFDSSMTPAPLAKQIKERWKAKQEKKEIGEVVYNVAGTSGYNSQDLLHLKDRSSDEFYDWLKSEEGGEWMRVIREFRSRFGGDETGKPIVEALDVALQRIGEDDLLNKKRIVTIIGYNPWDHSSE